MEKYNNITAWDKFIYYKILLPLSHNSYYI